MMNLRLFNLMPHAVRAGVAFLIAFMLTAGLTALTIRVCRKRAWVSKPRPDRWHAGTPAFFGGVPIYIGFLSGLAVFVPASDDRLWMLAGLSSLIFLVGFLDDIFHLAPGKKLLGQVAVAVLALNCGFVAMASNSPSINFAISLLWIVGITNGFNLLDNMDGLCAGTAILAAVCLAIFCLADGTPGGAMLLSMAAGSMAGFLLFNFHPARIFMGDAGSLFLGFLLANSCLMETTRASAPPSSLLAPAILLALPILDTSLVSVSRRLRGQPISQGGTDHTSHRLVRLGMQERSVVLLLYGITALAGSLAVVTRFLAYSTALVVTIIWFVVLLLPGILLFTPGSEVRVKLTAPLLRLLPLVNWARGAASRSESSGLALSQGIRTK